MNPINKARITESPIPCHRLEFQTENEGETLYIDLGISGMIKVTSTQVGVSGKHKLIIGIREEEYSAILWCRYPEKPIEWICRTILTKGWVAALNREESVILYNQVNPYQDLMQSISSINPLNGFRFNKFDRIEEGSIYFTFIGHVQNGSYIYATEYIPGYIKKLEEATGYPVSFIDRPRDGWYQFSIDLSLMPIEFY